MTTLLYHARTNGVICRRIAAHAPNIQVLGDKELEENNLTGLVIRWDSRHRVTSDETINTAEAVKLSRHKSASRRALGNLAPTTWFQLADCRYPCIVRPRRHHAAKKFFVCQNEIELRRAVRRCGKDWYASRVINKSLEYRVFVFQDHVIKIVRRFHPDPDAIAWNIANGGRSIRVRKESWPVNVAEAAVLAGRTLGLDWFAADIVIDADGGTPYVLELNTAPGLEQEGTLKLLARLFKRVKTISQNTAIPQDTMTGNTWQHLIHPALRSSQ